MCRGGGSRAQGLVRAGVAPTTPRSLERVWREISQLNYIEQTAHCDHKPWAARVFVRLSLHRRSAAGWAEYMC